MQNGKAALSILGYNYKKQPTQSQISELLNPIYRIDDTDTKISFSLFYPIRNQIKNEKNKIGFSNFFYKQLTKRIESKNFLCIYCGNKGSSEIISYIFPFITTIDKYPNIYSMGKIKSLNFCSRCMLISFAANSRWLFNVRSPTNKTNFFSAVMFFANNEKELRRFYRNFTERHLLPSLYTNIEILPQEFADDRVHENRFNVIWFPEEFLALLIYFISRQIKRFNIKNKNLGAILLSYNRTSSGAGAATIIYNSFDIVDDLFPFIKGIYNLTKNTKNDNSFLILFKHLKKDTFSNTPDDYVFRRQFFRKLLLNKQFDWKIIQSIVMLKATEDKNIPFLKSFIITMSDELSLNSDKAAFEDGNNIGYRIGKNIKKNEKNYKRLKKYIFDFRRCRRPKDFLSLLNLVQTQCESTVYADIFVNDNFEIAKTGFLIGFSNAIFIKENDKRNSNTTKRGK